MSASYLIIIFVGCICRVSAIDTTFFYYHTDNPNVQLTIDQVQRLHVKPTNILLYSHGLNSESLESAGSIIIKNEVLRYRKDIELVILANWCQASNQPAWKYAEIVEKTVPAVALDISNELHKLTKTVGIFLENVEMVGHSLGAHVIGKAARHVKHQGFGIIKMVVGLDPAGPKYRGPNYDGLMKGDAQLVYVIHTDDFLGIFTDIGDIDIYPYKHEEFRTCERSAMVNKCLHSLAKYLYTLTLQGIEIVDKNDPKRGKERIVNPVYRYPTQVTILVLDVSPSMKEFGRMESMVYAANQLVTQLPINSTVAVVIFGGHAQISKGLTMIRDESVRISVLAALPKRSPYTIIGATSIGAGLRAAISLPFVSESCPDIHLITDGEENTAPWRRDVQIPPCNRVNPIGLGGTADKGLEQLAAQTNGRMTSVSDVNSLTKLGEALIDATYVGAAPSVRPMRVFGEEIVVSEHEKIQFLIDQDIGKNLRLVINSPNIDKLKLSPILISPEGTVYDGKNFTKDYETFIFQQEVVPSGKWAFGFAPPQNTRRKRNTFPNKGTLSVTSLQRENHHAIMLDGILSNSSINYGDNSSLKKPIAIYGRIRKDRDFVLGAAVEAIVTGPDGMIVDTLNLLDNGLGADEDANDGVYSRYLSVPLTSGSRYEVTIKATCNESCQLRGKESYSFAPLSTKEAEKLPELYSFRRQINAGSIKAEGIFRTPLPSRVKNLEVTKVDYAKRLVYLEWNAGGGVADTGSAKNLELRVTWDYTRIVSLKGQDDEGTKGDVFTFTADTSTILEGGLAPLEVGERQKVTLEVPEILWEKSGNGQSIYFIMRAANDNLEWGEDSNIASIPTPESEVSDGVMWPYIAGGIGIIVVLLVVLAGVYCKVIKPRYQLVPTRTVSYNVNHDRKGAKITT